MQEKRAYQINIVKIIYERRSHVESTWRIGKIYKKKKKKNDDTWEREREHMISSARNVEYKKKGEN